MFSKRASSRIARALLTGLWAQASLTLRFDYTNRRLVFLTTRNFRRILLILSRFLSFAVFLNFDIIGLCTMSSEEKEERFPKFDGTDWPLWKLKIQALLEERDVWDIVSEEETLADGATDKVKKEFNKRERKAKSTIFLKLADSQMCRNTSAKTAVELWKALCEQNERDTFSNKLLLRQRLLALQMNEGDELLAHINAMKTIAEQLASLESAPSDGELVAKLMNSIPKSYDNLRFALETRPDDELTWDFVTTRLLLEEDRRKMQNMSVGQNTSDALATSGPRNSVHSKSIHSNMGSGNGGQSRAFGPGKGDGRNRKCYYCGKPGHYKKDCYKRQNAERNRGQANPAEHSKPSHGVDSGFFADQNACVAAVGNSTWFVDSGASQHMTCRKDWLVDFEHFPTPQQVQLGDNYIVEATGKGNIDMSFLLQNGENTAKMCNVWLVPKLAKNLFSVGAVTRKGKTVTFGPNNCQILDSGGNVVAEGSNNGRLYELSCRPCLPPESANIVTSKADVDLWHCRLGHMGLGRVKLMHKEGFVTGMDLHSLESQVSQCEACIMGKMAKKPFPKGKAHRAKGLLTLCTVTFVDQ